MIARGYLTEDGEEYAMDKDEPRCPICNFEWDHWIVCDHPGCHDGRLQKPETWTQELEKPKSRSRSQSPPWQWTQDDLTALLEIVDSLADVVERLSFHRTEQTTAESVAQRARALYRKMVGDHD